MGAGGAALTGRSAAEAAVNASVDIAVAASKLEAHFLMRVTLVQRGTGAAYGHFFLIPYSKLATPHD
jgi:hypothetical protein